MTLFLRNACLPILAPLAVAAVLATASTAHAGPTVSADLDLGTSVKHDSVYSGPLVGPTVGPSPLYIVGFRVRAGWRFDLGPIWLLPELGGGYDHERFAAPGDPGVSLPRAFGGLRGGVSLPVAPALRLEPAVFGHLGWAWYVTDAPMDGLAADVGAALDLRFLQRFIVGVHLGYDVVTTKPTVAGPPPSSKQVTLADGWVAYGLHAGVLLW
jgi:hypothetical protein